MLFNSIEFIAFFPVVTIIYFIFPKKYRYLWLLVTSYFFYMSWNVKYVFLLFTSTIITYAASLGIAWCDNIDKENVLGGGKKVLKKYFLTSGIVCNLLLLFFFKYIDFAIDSVNAVLRFYYLNEISNTFDIILPVGISFYIFQALGYTIDVYRGDVQAEKNFLRYALFVSFFPQLVAGPIERSKNLLTQLKEEHTFSFERMKDGLLLMLWGYFMKLVLADRIAIFVDNVYGDLDTYTGYYVLIASVLFAFQIYCDFAGYSTIAMGVAEILGFRLMENFNSPYLSKSVAEFWRRWHISLSAWFRDYLYIPLGGSKKGKARKYLNLFIVFLASGLWHGANWTYIIWGGINGSFQILGDLCKNPRNRMQRLFGLKRNTFSHKLLKIMFTFIFIDFAWIFFRVATISDAFKAITSICKLDNPWILFDGSLYHIGLTQKDYQLMWVGIGVLFLADILKYKGICIRRQILRQEWWFRWSVGLVGVLVLLVLGIYGYGYDAKNFIYFQF